MTAFNPKEQFEIDASTLMSRYPPVFRHPSKGVVYEMACPAGCEHRGTISYSRWRARPLPREITPSDSLRLEVRADVFDYRPVAPPRIDWHLNFADPHLFCAYGGALLAQDEMQVAEHPALGALREMLCETGKAQPLTVEHGEATPVLVAGVERRVAIHTEPNPEQGRPHGLYGNRFAVAPHDVLERALERIDPPTLSNILAMAAPSPGFGPYDEATIRSVLVTATTGFSAAVAESRRLLGEGARIFIHTGFWGCGAFGGNRTLMVGLQLVAAHVASLDGLVFHAVDERGVGDFEIGHALADRLLSRREGVSLQELLKRVLDESFEWGISDGN